MKKNVIKSEKQQLSPMPISADMAVIWDGVVSDIKNTLQSTGYTHTIFTTTQRSSLFSQEILFQLNLNDKKSLLTLKRATKDAVVMSVPGPVNILQSILEHNIEYVDEPYKVFDYGVSLVDEDNDVTTAPKQLHVFKAECVGDTMPVRDAELILTTYRMLGQLGIKNLIVAINELGGKESRKKYYDDLALKAQPRYAKLCQSLEYNPIRLYHELSDQESDMNLRLPHIVDYLSQEESQHFKSVLEFLETLDIPYDLDSGLAGSLGFNEGVYFEIRSQDYPEHVLVRGGRHNELFTLLGGESDSGSVGVEIYVDEIVSIVHELKLRTVSEAKLPDVFVASIGPEGQKSALKILSLIQNHGLGVKESFGLKSLKQQLLKAKKSDAEITLIVGRKEAVDGTVILRDKESENQEVIPIEKLLSIISQKLNKL